jgi:broad specificity phosphatase PhoE
MSFGDWEGLTYAQIQDRHPRELAAWHADITHVAPPGGEPLALVGQRVQAAFDDIVWHDGDEAVLLVSHGGPLRVLLCQAMGMDVAMYWRFSVGVASVSELGVYDRGSVLVRLNDTCPQVA